ncbi:MAG: putative 2-aminoethylphosphonate ABC transporter permease subunit [Candidatus Rokuibacteriota bacterium]|nr:MAG: putative 2-aminoethylphosphonate ABC transporter permease subunit [Candidatus Rokubacteria bacterium]
MRLFVGVIGLYLVAALALPLGLMLAKSFEGPREEFVGLANYVRYFSTPALFQSIGNSLWVSILSTLITVPTAFVYAYALTRSRIPFRGFFKTVALVPILVPSLLPGLALVYLFGNQGLLKAALLGHSIYGPIGIVMAEVFTTFPHALLIILAALALADARLYEAAVALRASRARIFWTVTLPGARYGLISATFVVFTTVVTDFGAPKVIGGQYNVLATDVYKQVIGQQNFQMGAVVSVILLVPAIFAFLVDRAVRRRQVALLSARAVPLEPKPQPLFDLAMLAYCVVVGLALLSIVAVSQFAAVVKFFPYNLTLTWAHYDFDQKGGGGWASYYNSIRLALLTSVVGTFVVFVGAYLVEKARGFALGRGLFHFLAMLPMAVPGLVLGLAYIFFFNAPGNPLNVLYRTMTILVINTIVHFYTVGHLTALTALRQMDPEFETVSASLKQPFYRTFWRVTVPVCLPSTLDIAIYMFVNAMTTVSGVVFIYGPKTELAAISVLNMDDTGEIASAAAMAMMIFYTNVAARMLHLLLARWLERRTQAWRRR